MCTEKQQKEYPFDKSLYCICVKDRNSCTEKVIDDITSLGFFSGFGKILSGL
uniref:Uncharacterized protein n=1 Tax=Seriola lalandi dorsalis TaxID=1841481 RepID=A0A3B4WYB8_SERLL